MIRGRLLSSVTAFVLILTVYDPIKVAGVQAGSPRRLRDIPLWGEANPVELSNVGTRQATVHSRRLLDAPTLPWQGDEPKEKPTFAEILARREGGEKPAGHAFDEIIAAKNRERDEQRLRKAAKGQQQAPAPAPVTVGEGVKIPDTPAPAPVPGAATPVWRVGGKPSGLIFEEFLKRNTPTPKPQRRPPGKGPPAATAVVPQAKPAKPVAAAAGGAAVPAAATPPAGSAKSAAAGKPAKATPAASPTPVAAPAKAPADSKAKAVAPAKPAPAVPSMEPPPPEKPAGAEWALVEDTPAPPVPNAEAPKAAQATKGPAAAGKGAAFATGAPVPATGKGATPSAGAVVPATGRGGAGKGAVVKKGAAPAAKPVPAPASKGINKILDIFRKKSGMAPAADKKKGAKGPAPVVVETKKSPEEKSRATEAFLGKPKGRPMADMVEPRPTTAGVGVVGQSRGDMGLDPDTFVSAAVHVMHRLFETVPEHHKGLDDDHRWVGGTGGWGGTWEAGVGGGRGAGYSCEVACPAAYSVSA
eukprot:jgi/Mesvir1/4349/Mv02433-RA.1